MQSPEICAQEVWRKKHGGVAGYDLRKKRPRRVRPESLLYIAITAFADLAAAAWQSLRVELVELLDVRQVLDGAKCSRAVACADQVGYMLVGHMGELA